MQQPNISLLLRKALCSALCCSNAPQSVNAPPNGVECARYVEGGSSCGHKMASAAGSAPSLASLPVVRQAMTATVVGVEPVSLGTA